MRVDDIVKLLLGTFVRPAEETGAGRPRVEAVYGYLIRHDRGLVLLDTGVGEGDPETEAWYRPQRMPLQQALAGRGVSLDELGTVVNCHLHFDHCGGNPLLMGTPVVCQRRECEDGSVVLAGQSHDTASAWSADALAVSASGLGHVEPLPTAPSWMTRLLEFDPKRVVFAHDAAVWEPT